MASTSGARSLAVDAQWTLPLDGGLRVRGTGDAGSPLLARFFAGYDKAFILPDEREELDGFRACLALNGTPAARDAHELILVLEDESGAMLGGANLLAVDLRGFSPGASINLNYLFVDGAARGRGLARALLGAVSTLGARAVGRAGTAPVIFIEQNDPLRMSGQAYAADSAHAGLDQVDRLAIWARLGARAMDFPYVQPALSADQGPDDGLIFAAIDCPGEAVEPALLRAHLERFFAVSVLKGGDPGTDPDAARQLKLLDDLQARGAGIALLAMEPVLARLRASRTLPAAARFRDFARGLGDRGDAQGDDRI